mmetsp:Transcript_30315/g.79423  ORF Transcript_30315/g.79423 Transcript_30315/m.79423 type:complete len:206 (-) Transcript_30315:448-1065(-)
MLPHELVEQVTFPLFDDVPAASHGAVAQPWCAPAEPAQRGLHQALPGHPLVVLGALQPQWPATLLRVRQESLQSLVGTLEAVGVARQKPDAAHEPAEPQRGPLAQVDVERRRAPLGEAAQEHAARVTAQPRYLVAEDGRQPLPCLGQRSQVANVIVVGRGVVVPGGLQGAPAEAHLLCRRQHDSQASGTVLVPHPRRGESWRQPV